MLARNSLISMSSSVVPVIVTVVTMPFLLDAIGVEKYGALALCWLILIYLGQADWGLGKAITHRVARLAANDEAAARVVMTSGIATAGIVGSAMALIAAGAAWLFFWGFFNVDEALRSELTSSVGLLGAATLATTVLQVLYGSLAGKERFASASLAMMMSNASLPLLTLATALLVDTDMVSLMAATLVGRLIGVIIAGSDVWMSQLRGHSLTVVRAEARKLLRFGFWIMTAQFTAPVLVTIDRLVIGANLGAAAVAAYTIPYQVVSRLQLIPISLMNVMFPRLSVVEGQKARTAAFHYTLTISAMFLPIVIGLIVVIRPLLDLWLGDNLDDRSVAVGIVLLCAFLFTAISQAVIVLLQSQEDGKFVAAFQLGEMPPYFLLLGYAAIEFGLLGVAIIFLLRRMIETVCFVVRARFGVVRFWKSQLPAIVGLLVALAIEPHLGGTPERFALGTVLALAAFVGAAMAAPSELRGLLIEQARKMVSKKPA